VVAACLLLLAPPVVSLTRRSGGGNRRFGTPQFDDACADVQVKNATQQVVQVVDDVYSKAVDPWQVRQSAADPVPPCPHTERSGGPVQLANRAHSRMCFCYLGDRYKVSLLLVSECVSAATKLSCSPVAKLDLVWRSFWTHTRLGKRMVTRRAVGSVARDYSGWQTSAWRRTR
jgi:hypothetical protein